MNSRENKYDKMITLMMTEDTMQEDKETLEGTMVGTRGQSIEKIKKKIPNFQEYNYFVS